MHRSSEAKRRANLLTKFFCLVLFGFSQSDESYDHWREMLAGLMVDISTALPRVKWQRFSA